MIFKNKKITKISIMVITVVLLTLIILFSISQINKKEPSPTTNTTPYKSEGTITFKQVDEKTFKEECTEYNQNYKLQCLGIATSDAKYCKEINPYENKTAITFLRQYSIQRDCYDDANLLIIIDEKGTSTFDCSNLSRQRELFCRAIKDNNIDLCNEIPNNESDIYRSTLCKVMLTRDTEYCNAFDRDDNCPVEFVNQPFVK